MQEALGRIISIIPGKSSKITMISIDDMSRLYFDNSKEPCAFIETLVNTGTDQSTTAEYSKAIIDLLDEKYGIPRNRIFVTVNEVDNWHQDM